MSVDWGNARNLPSGEQTFILPHELKGWEAS